MQKIIEAIMDEVKAVSLQQLKMIQKDYDSHKTIEFKKLEGKFEGLLKSAIIVSARFDPDLKKVLEQVALIYDDIARMRETGVFIMHIS
jgi:hypothetical protein